MGIFDARCPEHGLFWSIPSLTIQMAKCHIIYHVATRLSVLDPWWEIKKEDKDERWRSRNTWAKMTLSKSLSILFIDGKEGTLSLVLLFCSPSFSVNSDAAINSCILPTNCRKASQNITSDYLYENNGSVRGTHYTGSICIQILYQCPRDKAFYNTLYGPR